MGRCFCSATILSLTGILTGILLPPGSANAEIFDLGGMYTYHYHDGRYADWGDYARHGAHLAIEEINASGLLGTDRIRLRPDNFVMEDAVAQDFAGSCPYDEIVGTMDEMVRATHTFEKVLG